MNTLAVTVLLALLPVPSTPVPETRRADQGFAGADTTAVPVEEEPRHRTVFKNEFVQVFRVTLQPGEETAYHTHAHDDAAVRLSTSTVVSDSPGQAPKAPESVEPGFVSARSNEAKPLTHRVRNTGATVFDVLDVQVLKQPGGRETAPLGEPAAENPRLRAYRYELAPGASSAPHSHRRPYLIVAATDMNLTMTSPHGPSMTHPIKAGDLHWVEPPVAHTLTNAGAEKGVLVEIELK